MDYERTELLLEKFWDCETSPEEEKELCLFFNETKDLPSHLLQYRELFVYQEEEGKLALDESFDQRILAKISGKKKIGLHNSRWIGGIAASLLLIAGLCVLIQRQQGEADTYETPEQALAEVQRALSFVSKEMNQGRKIVEDNIVQMQKVTKYIQ